VNLSYVHGVGATPLIADSIGGALSGAAESWGDRDALVACHQEVQFETLRTTNLDDGHRESSEVQDAGDYHGGAGSRPGERREADLRVALRGDL